MSFVIVSDTCCNLPQHLIDAFSVRLIPLSYFMDGEPYTVPEGDTEFKDFYNQLRAGRVATTSLADRACAHDVLTDVLSEKKDVLYLGFSSKLSGTFDNVSSVAHELSQEHPDQKIICIDTKAASAGQSVIVHHVAKMRDHGVSLEDCAQWVTQHLDNISQWFIVDNLTYLARGGRISNASAFLGSALSIKPLLHVDNTGALVVQQKTRGRHKAFQALLDQFAQLSLVATQQNLDIQHLLGPEDSYGIYIAHGDCKDDAQKLAELLAERYSIPQPIITSIDPVIGAHTGPGLLALFFVGINR